MIGDLSDFDRSFEAESALTVAAVQGEPSAIPILASQILAGRNAKILNARMAAELLHTYETEEALDAIERLIQQKEARGVVKELGNGLGLARRRRLPRTLGAVMCRSALQRRRAIPTQERTRHPYWPPPIVNRGNARERVTTPAVRSTAAPMCSARFQIRITGWEAP